jgi:hypothetical protein
MFCQECKDLLGKFGQVQDKVLCGDRSILNLTNGPTYQNGTLKKIKLSIMSCQQVFYNYI